MQTDLKQELDAVQVVGRTPVTFSDKLAHGAVKLMRYVPSFPPFPICCGTRACRLCVHLDYHTPTALHADAKGAHST